MAKKKKSTKKSAKQKTKIGKKITIWAFKVILFFIAFVIVFIGLVYVGMFGKIPSETELKKIKTHSATAVYSSNGTMIGKFYIENRLTINNKDISQNVSNALVATEDSRFFEHKGVDIISTGRVFVRTLLFGDKKQGGGSTISQQLAKNLFRRKSHGFLTSPVNKTREIIIAGKLESIFSKEEILGLYLNTVPFGENIYGIEVAANRFFGKSSSALTVPEAATLIGMLAANTAYNPRINPERSLQRRNLVIDRMCKNGSISLEEAENFKETPLKLNYSRVDLYFGPAPYFMEQVRSEAEKILKEKYGTQYDILTDGLKIHTTLDATLQSFAVNALRTHMKYLQKTFDDHWGKQDPWHDNQAIFKNALQKTERYKSLKTKGLSEEDIIKELEKPVEMTIFAYDGETRVSMSPIDSLKRSLRTLHTGFMALNPQNGHVLAWEGGINFRYFQYDHVYAKRQVGSTFKPIVYATAINKGYEPCEFVSNERRVYEKYKNWSPANADNKYEGYYSIKGGLVHSVNTIAAEMIDRTGSDEVIKTARRMGITSEIPNVPSIALGTANISLYEMVVAYSAFANYGRAVKPVIILKIEDFDGNILFSAPKEEQQFEKAFNDETSRIMVQIMREIVENGTAKSLRSVYGLQGDYAGKTGTTQNNADGWFVGFAPNIVAGVWVGAENPAIHFRTLALGQGAHTALPVFARFMQQTEKSKAHSYIKNATFPPLNEETKWALNCNYYELEDPTIDSFWEQIFGGKERKKDKDDKQKGGIFDFVKDIFKKK
ncbi:MAG: transglycosylase domain-containing protein [Marinilabiliaceae bacterium]|nr:transglycosylase domain-containing protein [Marinilabiliaceae bacterium]